jgi:hypothetical protein
MIVDDSVVNLRLTKRKIQLAFGESCSVVTCDDGAAAIESFTSMIKDGSHSKLTGESNYVGLNHCPVQ